MVGMAIAETHMDYERMGQELDMMLSYLVTPYSKLGVWCVGVDMNNEWIGARPLIPSQNFSQLSTAQTSACVDKLLHNSK